MSVQACVATGLHGARRGGRQTSAIAALAFPEVTERAGLLLAADCNDFGCPSPAVKARDFHHARNLRRGRAKRALTVCAVVAALFAVLAIQFAVRPFWRRRALAGSPDAGISQKSQEAEDPRAGSALSIGGESVGKLKEEVEEAEKENLKLQEMVARAAEENEKLMKKLAQAETQTPVVVPQGRPVCNGHVAEPPVEGKFLRHGLPHGGEAWDFALKANCSYALWEQRGVKQCLSGTWVALVGASNMNLWALELANLLSPNALSIAGDYFNIDGVYTQLIDLVIEDGNVVYRNVLVDDERKADDSRIGVHSVERDSTVLKFAFSQVDRAPQFYPNRTRLTYFIAEFWDHVDLAIDAVEATKGWAGAEVTAAVSVGRWYANAIGCTTTNWCAVRPELGRLQPDQLVQHYIDDTEAALLRLGTFCSPPGRAGQRGCAVFSLTRCETMVDPKWPDFHDAIVTAVQGKATPQLRFVNMWDLTSELPEDCMTGHQSQMSTLWTLQVLLGGICDAADAAEGTLASFKGHMCRTAQVTEKCPDPSKKAVRSLWECGHTEPCTLVPVGPTVHGADQRFEYQE